MGIFDNAVSVVIGNKIVDSITTSDNGVIYERSEHTRLSIDVPLNLTYSDAFNISGHLTTANGTGISGEQVVLKVGNSVVDSTTTTNNGAYSFTQTPVSTGNHSFQVVYAGSNSYGSSESSRVTRDINKETSVLTATLDKTKYDIGDNVVITAHLTDDEGNEISDPQEIAHLKINYNGTWENIGLMNFLTNNTITIPYQEGYNSTWQLKHEETNNYAESSINIPLNIVTPTLISSSATNQIIGSGDSTTVTATLLDQDGDAIPNRSMSYVVKHGSTTLDSGSATTNSSGQVSVSYTGTSVGAVDFEFKYGMLLQETFVLWDTIKYDNGTSASHDDSIWDLVNTSLDRQANYTVLTETDTSNNLYARCGIPNECTIEFEVLQVDGSTTSFYCQFFNQNKSSRGGSGISNIGGSLNNWLRVKIELTSTQAVFTNLDTMATATRTISGTDVSLFGFSSMSTISTLYFRNFKVY